MIIFLSKSVYINVIHVRQHILAQMQNIKMLIINNDRWWPLWDLDVRLHLLINGLEVAQRHQWYIQSIVAAGLYHNIFGVCENTSWGSEYLSLSTLTSAKSHNAIHDVNLAVRVTGGTFNSWVQRRRTSKTHNWLLERIVFKWIMFWQPFPFYHGCLGYSPTYVQLQILNWYLMCHAHDAHENLGIISEALVCRVLLPTTGGPAGVFLLYVPSAMVAGFK